MDSKDSHVVTALDTETALIVTDLQKGLATYPMTHPVAEVVRNTRVLAEAFRHLGDASVPA